MELKWLEDFISVGNHGHFSKAADERYISQSAITRHIQALEQWVGTPLLNRSKHPVQLTTAGRRFHKLAREIVRASYEAQITAREFGKNAETRVTIAGLHTLVLYKVPELSRELYREVGQFETSVIAETRTIEEYLQGLFGGLSDFFICYRHSASAFEIDDELFPRIDIDIESIKPYQRAADPVINLNKKSVAEIPYLKYSGTSFMSRIIEPIIQNADFYNRLKTVYQATLAESLMHAAQGGMGVAWLPDCVTKQALQDGSLRLLSEQWSTSLQISIFRSAKNNRDIVNQIWEHWESQVA